MRSSSMPASSIGSIGLPHDAGRPPDIFRYALQDAAEFAQGRPDFQAPMARHQLADGIFVTAQAFLDDGNRFLDRTLVLEITEEHDRVREESQICGRMHVPYQSLLRHHEDGRDALLV